MISSAAVTSILPVSDVDRARRFYVEALGLPDEGQAPDGNHLLSLSGGNTLALMTAEEGAQTGHTVLSFEVQDIGAEIRELESRGVTFDDYDLPGLKTVEHVCVIGSDKAAWFRDTEGNILCLHQSS
jgi:catechol 2,3-dioxygenase-like lactoylglutathione lyase family enzyme